MSKHAVAIVAAIALYGLAVLLPLDFEIQGRAVTFFAPSSGLALMIALRFGPLALLPAIGLYGAFMLYAGAPVLTAVGMSVGMYLQGIGGAWLFQRVMKGDGRLRTREDLFKYIGAAVLAAPAIAATVGTAVFVYTGIVEPSMTQSTWIVWWYGESLGMMFTGPILLGGAAAFWRSIRPRATEAAVVGLATIAISVAVFYSSPGVPGALRAPLALLPLPFLFWSANRLGTPFTALLLTAFGTTIALGSQSGFGPFGGISSAAGMITLWTYAQFTGMAALVMGGLLSERDDAVSALRGSEAKFRNLVEAGPSVVYAFPHNDIFKITYISPQSLALLGHTPEECYKRHGIIANMIHPDDINRVAIEVQDAWLHKKTMLLEYRLIRRDGEVRWVRDEATYMPPRGEMAAFWQGVLVDVTPHRATVELHRKTQELLSAIWKSSNGAIFVVDTTGSMIMANPAAENMMALLVDELTGRPYNDPEFRCETEDGAPLPEAAYPYRLVMDTQQPLQNYVHVITNGKGIRRVLSVDGSPLRDADGNLAGAFFIAEDITLAREAEEQRRSLEAQLRHAQKIEAVGQLAGGVAHDFNNLLQVMLGFTRLAMETGQPESQRQSHLRNVSEAAEKAAALTSQLLAFGRRQALEKSDCDLNQLVRDHLKLVHRVLGEHIEIVFFPADILGNVRVDRSQIEQILLNLCLNARDAMPGGGRLTIGLANCALDDTEAEAHPGARQGQFALLTVSDTGSGMDQATQARIFEPFYTTKPQGHGTGLGLSVVHGIIQQHEGVIQVESEPGRGTTFRIYLPITPKMIASAPPRPAPKVPSNTGTILLAEDELGVREIAVKLLQRAGYHVIAAQDGEEAVAKFREHANDVSLLMLDVVMPRMNGLQAFEAISAERPGIPTLFCSGYSGLALDTVGELPMGTHFLQKPYNFEQLIEKLADMLRQVRGAAPK